MVANLARLSLILAILAAPLWSSSAVKADILISPLRQVLTPGAGNAVFTISNPSDRIVDVRISWIDLTATATGYRDASPEERAAISAAPFLTLSPAFHRLQPGARETVTVSLRGDLVVPRGERRSHLLFESAAHRTNLQKISSGLEADIGLSVSAPVILRSQNTAPGSASFTATRLVRDDKGDLVLETTLKRKGLHSTFGRLDVEMTQEGEKIPRRLSTLANAAVFTDISERTFSLPLGVSELPKSILKTRYLGAAEYEGKVIAEKRFSIAAPE